MNTASSEHGSIEKDQVKGAVCRGGLCYGGSKALSFLWRYEYQDCQYSLLELRGRRAYYVRASFAAAEHEGTAG